MTTIRKLKVGDLFIYEGPIMNVKGIIINIYDNQQYLYNNIYEFKIIESSPNWYPESNGIESFCGESHMYINLVIKAHLTDSELLL